MSEQQLAMLTPNDIAQTSQRFLEFVELTKQIEAVWSRLKDEMLISTTKSLKGDWGMLYVGERKNWKANKILPAEFYEQKLNTKELNHLFETNPTALPEGVDFTVTTTVTRRLK